MSVDAKELRIGNWVKIRGLYYVQVNSIWIDWFSYNEQNACNYNDTEGILLTKEILKECTFDNKDDFLFSINSFTIRKRMPPFVDGYLLLIDFYPVKYGNTIFYLHQLQNLYWCLVGKELEINLTL